jgi:hypothetical protein
VRTSAPETWLREPPQTGARWTLELLADEPVKLTEHDNISRVKITVTRYPAL